MLAVAGCLMMALPVSHGQQAGEQRAPATAPTAAPGGDAPESDSLLGKESNQGVYVRDSAVAVEKFALAHRMERLKEWDKAASALQEIVEKYPDRVVPSQTDANQVIYQYTSVVTAVQERLAKWPEEGLDVYRTMYEPAAKQILSGAAPGDLTSLHRVCSLYFVTESAKTAGMRLVESYLEAGEFPAAAWLGDRLATWHPLIGEDRPMLLYRASLAHHLAGDAATAQARLKDLSTKYPEARGVVRGEEVTLAESLAAELQVAPPVANAIGSDSWPIFGGSPDRGRVPAFAGRFGAKINEIPYVRSNGRRPVPGVQRIAATPADIVRNAREAAQALGIMAVVDRGELFFQDNARVYAVSVESGIQLPGWGATYPPLGQYLAPSAEPLPRNQQMTVTVTDGSVLAIMGQLDRSSMNEGVPQRIDRETRLVCLDRTTGKPRWTATPRQLPEAAAALRTLELGGSPLVVGDNVYVLGRGGKPMQFEDSYVLCYSLNDGSYRWSCYIASGNANPEDWDGGIGLMSDNVSHTAYASGRIYALTNLGALAAIDAYSGQIVWLNIYPRPKPVFAPARFDRGRQEPYSPKPWAHNPVIVKDGKVFILPDDAEHVLIYDAGSGVELKRISTTNLNPDEREPASTLLGVVDDKLVLCSNRSVFCVNWARHDPAQPRTENLEWVSTLARQSQPSDSIRGRGFLTTDSVFVPTAWALIRISLQSGKVEETYPKGRSWDQGEGPGNVLVTQDHVIIATADRVNLYTDLALALAKLDREIAADPKNPMPRVKYAEVLLVSGQNAAGLARLDEAIALLGGPRAMRSGQARDGVFNIALDFAQKLSPAKDMAPPAADVLTMARELFDRAGAAAASPSQKVNYRISRAQFAEATGNHAAEVRLYQEILSDPPLRTVPFSGPDGTATQAAAVAEAAIRERMARAGPTVYAEFETAAREAFTAAVAAETSDPAALLALAERYPNAAVAPEAMAAAADGFEAAGNHRRATQVLNQIYRKYRDTADRARLIESQARNYLMLPKGSGVAIARLSEGAKLPGEPRLKKPLKLPNGTVLENVTFKGALDALREHSAQLASAQLPDFHLPTLAGPQRQRPGVFVPATPDDVISDVDLIVAPLREFTRFDRLLTWTNGGRRLSIFAAGETTPLATATLGETPRGCAWIDKNLLVWSATRMTMLAADTGSVLWEKALADLGDVEIVAAGGEVAVDGDVRGDGAMLLGGNEMVQFRGGRFRGRVGGMAVQMAARPPGDNGPEQIAEVCPIADRAVVSTSNGRIVAIDYAGGNAAWQTRLSETPLEQLLANDDFAVARVRDIHNAQIVVIDTFSGQLVSRRLFNAEGVTPVNMALSEDGMLVYTLPDRLCGKDLHEPSKDLSFEHPNPSDNIPRYAGAGGPDQLVIVDGRILVVCDGGQAVRVHSQENGAELPGSRPLTTQSSNWNVSLRVVGPRLYVRNRHTVLGYNLDRSEETWTGIPMQPTPTVVDMFIGRDYVVLLDQLGGNPDAAMVRVLPNGARLPGGGIVRAGGEPNPAGYRLLAFWREMIPRDGILVESGRLDHVPVVATPGIVQWQPAEGGFYYRTVDRKLHFLRGARPGA
jgi:outer membrane protein assembly factor BamB/TolA-binding protein